MMCEVESPALGVAISESPQRLKVSIQATSLPLPNRSLANQTFVAADLVKLAAFLGE